jgi:hypothetical protein
MVQHVSERFRRDPMTTLHLASSTSEEVRDTEHGILSISCGTDCASDAEDVCRLPARGPLAGRPSL